MPVLTGTPSRSEIPSPKGVSVSSLVAYYLLSDANARPLAWLMPGSLTSLDLSFMDTQSITWHTKSCQGEQWFQ